MTTNPTTTTTVMDQPTPAHPPFDLLTYISRYDKHSETYLQRCLFLGHCFHDIAITSNAAIGASAGGRGTTYSAFDDDAAAQAQRMAQLAFNLAIGQMKENGKYKRYCEEYTPSTNAPEGFGMPGGGGVIEDTMTNPEEETSSYKAARLDDNSNSGGRNIRNNAVVANNSNTDHGGGGGGVGGGMVSSSTASKKYTLLLQPYISTHPYDSTFVSQSTILSKQRIDILEGRLSTAQSKMQREAIRVALLAIGEYHISIGDIREAYRRILRAREYCTTGRQHGQINLLLLQLCIDLSKLYLCVVVVEFQLFSLLRPHPLTHAVNYLLISTCNTHTHTHTTHKNTQRSGIMYVIQ